MPQATFTSHTWYISVYCLWIVSGLPLPLCRTVPTAIYVCVCVCMAIMESSKTSDSLCSWILFSFVVQYYTICMYIHNIHVATWWCSVLYKTDMGYTVQLDSRQLTSLPRAGYAKSGMYTMSCKDSLFTRPIMNLDLLLLENNVSIMQGWNRVLLPLPWHACSSSCFVLFCFKEFCRIWN